MSQDIRGIAPPFPVLDRAGFLRPYLPFDNQPLQTQTPSHDPRGRSESEALIVHNPVYYIKSCRVAYLIVIHSSCVFLLPPHLRRSCALPVTCIANSKTTINNSMPCLRISSKSNAIRNLSQIIHHINSVSLLTPNFR